MSCDAEHGAGVGGAIALLFPNGLNHHNNIALAKAAKRNIVSFKASDRLAANVA
jgi:hypothetical protein